MPIAKTLINWPTRKRNSASSRTKSLQGSRKSLNRISLWRRIITHRRWEGKEATRLSKTSASSCLPKSKISKRTLRRGISHCRQTPCSIARAVTLPVSARWSSMRSKSVRSRDRCGSQQVARHSSTQNPSLKTRPSCQPSAATCPTISSSSCTSRQRRRWAVDLEYKMAWCSVEWRTLLRRPLRCAKRSLKACKEKVISKKMKCTACWRSVKLKPARQLSTRIAVKGAWGAVELQSTLERLSPLSPSTGSKIRSFLPETQLPPPWSSPSSLSSPILTAPLRRSPRPTLAWMKRSNSNNSMRRLREMLPMPWDFVNRSSTEARIEHRTMGQNLNLIEDL